MIKSTKIDSFLEKKVCDKDEKKCIYVNYTFHENQEFKTIKIKFLKFLKLYIMNLKIH